VVSTKAIPTLEGNTIVDVVHYKLDGCDLKVDP
jgi:hypothetical protein